ncbi:MAG: RagB/SusD family nutrient uptake outer membrane protein [Sphingobacteriaceae bacterium]|jgi:hypothetical protein|nr:RagB/SusD family nutrient uptake outer membrane protein [Sphingobacteriaceae bacterium]
MKKSFLYLILPALVLSSGCKKYLEHLPDQRTQLNTPEKVSELLVTAYPAGHYFTFAEAMSDNPVDVSPTGVLDNRNAAPYFWQDVLDINQDSPTYYWNECYSAIAAANQALDACNKASNPAQYSAQKGEALVARAYAHFMLVTLFSKAYDPATASTDLGIPYVLEPENVVIKKYERKTVAYVYEQIEKDLKEGLPLIVDNYDVPAYHFTRKAANAFATRFYLFKKDPAKVIEHANAAFPANNFAANVRPWLSYQSFTADELRANFTNASNPGNLLLAETVSLWARNYYRYRYDLTQAKLNTIVAPLGQTLTAYARYSTSSTFYFVMKFVEHFVRININATTGTAYAMVPLFTTEEVLLNRAEAYIMQDKYTEALADMNTLISTRVVGYNPGTHNFTDNRIRNYYAAVTTDQKQAYLNALLDLKRAEFVHEGMRWLDILRHKLPVTHRTSDNQVFELTANDPRKVVQLPEAAIQAGLEPNPR